MIEVAVFAYLTGDYPAGNSPDAVLFNTMEYGAAQPTITHHLVTFVRPMAKPWPYYVCTGCLSFSPPFPS